MMGIICKVVIKYYSVIRQCGGSRGTGEKWKVKKGREKMKKKKTWG
jgi:hypothetical protein